MEKLTLQDLKVGMHVKTEQLSNIYGVWIYINPKTATDNEVDILYFCTSENKNDSKIIEIEKKFGKTTVVYQPKFYADEDMEVYD